MVISKNDMLYTMKDAIGDPTWEKVIIQLQELAQKGYISFPEYIFDERHDNDGNPIWYCECRVKEYDEYYWSEQSSKKTAKRDAAYGMLLNVLGMPDDRRPN